MPPTTKQIGHYLVQFDAGGKEVIAGYIGATTAAIAQTFDTEEKAYTQYVRLSSEETVLRWIDTHAKKD